MRKTSPIHCAQLVLAFFVILLVPITSVCGEADDGAPVEYAEPLRPQFHFTARKNWLNDPNGLVFFQGEYHQFFQYNPLGLKGGDLKAWGHAVSPDLVHWRELDIALNPDSLGSIWSGSAVVDWRNTSGFQMGASPPLVAIYTTAGGKLAESKGEPFTQSVAYSNDRGRTWTKYPQNPVVGNLAKENRDPKVIWHEPSKQWVMALYLSDDRFALLGSPDLKEWKKLDEVRIVGSSECPDFFPLPIENEPGSTKWIFWSASNKYLIGDFDGRKFVDESGPVRDVVGANYAAQTFSDTPAADGRRIQIAWMRDGRYPRMPFNQQMSFPTVLALRRFPEGLRLTYSPVKELSLLHDRRYAWSGELGSSTDPLTDVVADACELRAIIDPADAKTIVFTIRGLTLTYDPATCRLSTPKFGCDLPMTDGKVRLVILIDRTSAEVFAQDGRVLLTQCFLPPADERRITLSGAGAKVESLECWTLKSGWRSSDR
jgi:fructan beta-fructosidase